LLIFIERCELPKIPISVPGVARTGEFHATVLHLGEALAADPDAKLAFSTPDSTKMDLPCQTRNPA
jgi:hypothetical protein